jgi:hypothetical protein
MDKIRFGKLGGPHGTASKPLTPWPPVRQLRLDRHELCWNFADVDRLGRREY